MGIGFIFTSLLLLGDVGRLVVQAFYWLSGARGPGEGLADPARRLFFARAVALVVGAAGVGLSALGLREALGALRTKEVEVKLKGLPAALAGLRLVQISDVHVGPLLHKEWLARVVEKISALKPDLVVITGDLVDGSVEQLREHVAPLARLQELAPRGVFFVTGNHDYYSGADEWSAHLPTLGVRPLRNERVEVAPGLDLAGIDDLTDPGSRSGRNLTRALAGRDPQRPVVLLAHQPKQFLQAAQLGVDLTLSGHTHGGQIFPFNFFVKLQQPVVSGFHVIEGVPTYTSAGTGYWGPPFRIGARGEVTELTLRAVPA
jgi:predicted MPP superfamily phosphohydrolase